MTNQLERVRLTLEEREEQLSRFAARSRHSRGRQRPEESCPLRLEFQRDRDRILHCNSFRRLKHKTQVFVAPVGDHYVTRLTHTLEVSQIARTISRALNLNEDLTEAISLAHDLGHTPFGHIGEEVLNDLSPRGFRHNEQSLRIVELLENNGRGLNLTWEVRDGILNHSKTRVIEIMGENWGKSGSLEGEVCKISDAVAYINHDIDDAIRAGIITETDLPAEATALLGHSRSERINSLVSDIVISSFELRLPAVSSQPAVKMSDPVREAARRLHEFLYENVYQYSSQQPDAAQARQTVKSLYLYFSRHAEKLPVEYNDPERQVVDYIASMTDNYALREARTLHLI
ncbi:MAG TPA: deoxyguanosinetriphosphate triphosphohydrolase [Dehalococcoidales bacterium]|nr:deoxyguanosinetriphosphate triphosphohydrolase [Dehalococcoidales bacterium]